MSRTPKPTLFVDPSYKLDSIARTVSPTQAARMTAAGIHCDDGTYIIYSRLASDPIEFTRELFILADEVASREVDDDAYVECLVQFILRRQVDAREEARAELDEVDRALREAREAHTRAVQELYSTPAQLEADGYRFPYRDVGQPLSVLIAIP